MIRLFRVSLPTSIVLLILSETILIAGCYVVAGLFELNQDIDPWAYFLYDNGWLQVLLVVAIIQLGLYLMDFYDDVRLQSRAYLFQQLCMLVGVTFLVQALVGYSKSTLLQLPQWTMLVGSLLVLVVIPLWRTIFIPFVRNALPTKKLLLLGVSPVITGIMARLRERPDFGFSIIGYVDIQDGFEGAPFLGSVENLAKIVAEQKPDRVVVSPKETTRWLPTQTLLDLRMSGLHLEEAATLYEEVFGRVSLSTLETYSIIFSKELGPRPWTVRLQTVYSFVFAVGGLVVCLPIMALVALAVRLSSPGPALCSQKRVGFNGAQFKLYKFRSMYIDAEARSGPVWASKNDPRITPVGRWLRKLRLDELPQFLNVIRGEMALVGPRPERPEFCKLLEENIPFYHQRHSVKPGITGWAQINLEYTDTVEDAATKLEYDLYYAKNPDGVPRLVAGKHSGQVHLTPL